MFSQNFHKFSPTNVSGSTMSHLSHNSMTRLACGVYECWEWHISADQSAWLGVVPSTPLYVSQHWRGWEHWAEWDQGTARPTERDQRSRETALLTAQWSQRQSELLSEMSWVETHARGVEKVSCLVRCPHSVQGCPYRQGFHCCLALCRWWNNCECVRVRVLMFPLAVEMYTDYNRANSSTIKYEGPWVSRWGVCLFVQMTEHRKNQQRNYVQRIQQLGSLHNRAQSIPALSPGISNSLFSQRPE